MGRAGTFAIFFPVLLASCASAGAASPPRHRVPGCVPAHARVLLADGGAAVYRIHATHTTHGEREAVIVTRGCTGSNRRSYKIWEEPVGELLEIDAGISNLTLCGTAVAYEQSYFGGSRYTIGQEVPEEWHVIVVDLRTRHVLHKVPTGVAEHPMWIGDGPTTAIVAKADGAVAWILDLHGGGSLYQVHALDRAGERVLATGSDIGPESLSLSGSSLKWSQGGKWESATLQ